MIKSLSYRPDHISKNTAGKGWLGHIPFAHWLVGALKPRTFVELGTHEGASYFSFCDSVLENGLTTSCHAVDSWQGDAQAGMYGEDVFNFVKKINSEKYKRFSKLHKCLFDEALDKFDDGTIDLLHIDGFHSYEAVTHDFETWAPKLAYDAVVLFHDTRVFKPDFGVHKFWAELSNQNPKNCFEFFHSFGLGVLCTGATGNIYKKLGSEEVAEDGFRRLFEAAGNEIISQNETPKMKTVTPNEVVHLVKQLSAQSDTYRRAICDLVS